MQNVVVLFSAPDFTAKDYDQVWDDLRAAGQEFIFSYTAFQISSMKVH